MTNKHTPIPVREPKMKTGSGKATFKTATAAARASQEARDEAWKHKLESKFIMERAERAERRIYVSNRRILWAMIALTLVNLCLAIFI